MTDSESTASSHGLSPALRAQEKEGQIIIDKDGYLVVTVGGGAQMTCPTETAEWRMRYGDKPAMLGASITDSFNYLVMCCNKEEAWRRINIMRAAILTHRKNLDEPRGLSAAERPVAGRVDHD